MRISTLPRFFHAFVVCSLVGIGLLVVGCDSGGSNGGTNTADFTGKWELTKINGNSVPSGEVFFSITTEEVKIIEPSSDPACETETITNIDGNTITTSTGEGTVEVSDNGNTLTLEGLVENANTATATRVSSVPDVSCP